MILLDALHINNGGGKVLLDYLIKKLEETELPIYYLLDIRVKINIPTIKVENTVQHLEATIYKRYSFYRKNRTKFSKILCFGNLPPTLKTTAKVFTYFHQPVYLEIPREFSIFDFLKFKLKIKFINNVKQNTDFWIVQNEYIKGRFVQKYKVSSNQVFILPFFMPMVEEFSEIQREENSFLYVSNAGMYKNHLKLINAFCNFYDTYKKGKLILTVNNKNRQVINLIAKKKEKKYPIKNIGFVKRVNLYEHYRKSKFLIFPSQTESFGLGIIEAIEHGCQVIGADLPYMYQVCIPSLVFNPFKIESIQEAFVIATTSPLKDTEQKIHNQIEGIIELMY